MRSALIAASTPSRAAAPRLAGALLRTQPDARLAKLAGEGSDAAFEEIVRRYRTALVSFATRISSRDSADDLVQDSMVKAHAALVRGDRPSSPRAWLYAIVRNTALNDRRDNRAHEYLDASHDGVEQPPDVADRRRRVGELVAAMRSLPRAQREALVRRELEGKGHDEIAAELEVSPGAVRQLIFRARAALRAGIGALLPMQLIRAAVLSGASEQAGAGATATGAGIATKLGAGAVLTTGALFAGTPAVKDGAAPRHHQPGTKAVAAANAPPSPAAHRSDASAGAKASHRPQVIVRPNQGSTRPSSTPHAQARGGTPEGTTPGTQTYTGSAPAPGELSGCRSAYLDGGGQTQPYSAPETRDCQNDGSRDPGPVGCPLGERNPGSMKSKALLLVGTAAVLVASLFALPALASSRDSNGDRIPDRWEKKYDLSLAKNQAPRDQDKDGVKNLAEYRDGTSPRAADTDEDGTTDGTDPQPCAHETGGDTTTTTTTTTTPAFQQ